MCGICGELRFDGAVDVGHLGAMRDQLVHRGPDAAGIHVSPDRRLGFGFRRLQIVDLTPNANQPMTNEDGSIWLVFNGEIYNFQELRRDLEARGHRFRSRADSEVIIHLYEEKGADCVAELDGMFALAIWDEPRKRLTLARDRPGKKPLFYMRLRDRFVFASEIKAFFVHPGLRLEIDEAAVPQFFLHGYVPCPDTCYQGVKQVPPATVMTLEADGRIGARAYWRLEEAARRGAPSVASRAEAAARVRELTTAAVRRRLVSDVPLGAFLSGGVDSTIVVGIMSQLSTRPVRTFSIGFEGDPAYDETAFARLVADRFKTEHTEFRVKPAGALDLMEKLIWHHDGPFGDSSAVPTFLVSELTRQHVTVVLTGDGGDELFAGYSRFRAALVAERVPRAAGPLLRTLARGLGRRASGRHWASRLQRFTRAVDLPLHDRMVHWSGLFFDDLEGLLAPAFRDRMDPVSRQRHLEAEHEAMAGQTTLGKLLHANFRSYLLDDLLVKTDRCTMAASLEARSPFLDTALVEYAFGLPDGLKLRGSRTKAVLRDAFADLLPAEVQTRAKMGFGVPFGTWFRGSLREPLRDLLLPSNARYRDYLSAAHVRTVVEHHLSGRHDYGLQLWGLACFELWLQLLPGWQRERRRAS